MRGNRRRDVEKNKKKMMMQERNDWEEDKRRNNRQILIWPVRKFQEEKRREYAEEKKIAIILADEASVGIFSNEISTVYTYLIAKIQQREIKCKRRHYNYNQMENDRRIKVSCNTKQ